MKPHLFRKLCVAVADLPTTLRRPKSSRIIMTLLVKDEEELLAHNLEFHHAMGVDGFIVTDNNSTDHTPDIIRQYTAKGWILESILERGTNYAQKQWVDRMAWMAKRRYGADWIINADADEFWYAPTGNLKDELRQRSANILHCKTYSLYPDEGRHWTEWDKVVRNVPVPEAYGLPLHSLFARQRGKVLHRAAGYIQISMGNHKVAMLPNLRRECDIIIYHYNLRSRKQFIEKMANGGQALEHRNKKHGGAHWRHFYQLWKEGRLEEMYDQVIGRHCYETLRHDGYIVEDHTMASAFAKLGV